jgi:dolichol-phosphate mannosyltransferase
MTLNFTTANRQVPTYNIEEFQYRKSKYCVCVFVINEGLKIRKQLEKMAVLAEFIDVIVADGGSTDGSLEQDFLRTQKVRALLTKTGAGKLSAQMRMAFDYALRQSYEGIVIMDGNDKDDPGAIHRFIDALDAGYDHIQGSRFIPGGKSTNTPVSRYLGIRFVHAPLISLFSGFHFTDTTNGFRAYSSSFLLEPRVDPFRDIFSLYELHYYLAIRSAKLGFKLLEVPVSRHYPGKGKVPTKISPIRGNYLVLITLFKACLGWFDPPNRKDTTR